MYDYVQDPDSRPTAVALGVIGWLFVVMELILMLIMDIQTCSQKVRAAGKKKKTKKKDRVSPVTESTM